MSGIQGRNTKPEILIRSLLHRQGFRFRLNVRDLAGKPDIVLPRYGAVIFVHGCFWHGHNCSFFKWPATRPEFWLEKIKRNRTNDRKTRRTLQAAGWRVGVIWECTIRGKNKDTDELTRRIGVWLRGNKPLLEIRG